MAEVIFLVGLPGSGKSTYAGYLAKSGYKVFSSDAFREATGITNSAVVFKNLCRSIKQAVRDGHDCVLDATNLVADKRIDNYQRRTLVTLVVSKAPSSETIGFKA